MTLFVQTVNRSFSHSHAHHSTAQQSYGHTLNYTAKQISCKRMAQKLIVVQWHLLIDSFSAVEIVDAYR